jgi:hypothetical protein
MRAGPTAVRQRRHARRRAPISGSGAPRLGAPQRAQRARPLTMLKLGAGLPLQKLDSVQVAFLSMEILELSFSCSSSGGSAW